MRKDITYEMISDESFYIMLLKSKNAIKSFPDFDQLLNPENLKNGFCWLCELTEDEDLPIVTEIFQSCFSEIIYELLDSANEKELENISVGQFLLRCYERKNNRIIKKCENCGRLFIPQKRNDAIFCMKQSPQNPNKTCKEIGAQERKKLKITIDPLEKNRHREYSKWSMAIKRARERGEDESYYLKKLEEVIRRD